MLLQEGFRPIAISFWKYQKTFGVFQIDVSIKINLFYINNILF